MSLDNIINALDGAKERGGRYTAKCPAHNDKSPSLMVSERDDGSTSIYCFAGCAAVDVLAALGLSEREAWRPLRDKAGQQWQIQNDHIRRVLAAIKSDEHQIKMLSTEFSSKKINAHTVVRRISKMAPSVFCPPLRLDRETKDKQLEAGLAWIELAICVAPTTEILSELFDLVIKFSRREDRQPIIKWEDQGYAKDFIDSIKN